MVSRSALLLGGHLVVGGALVGLGLVGLVTGGSLAAVGIRLLVGVLVLALGVTIARMM